MERRSTPVILVDYPLVADAASGVDKGQGRFHVTALGCEMQGRPSRLVLVIDINSVSQELQCEFRVAFFGRSVLGISCVHSQNFMGRR